MAVQFVSCGVLPPGLVQDCSQHSCVIAVDFFFFVFFYVCDTGDADGIGAAGVVGVAGVSGTFGEAAGVFVVVDTGVAGDSAVAGGSGALQFFLGGDEIGLFSPCLGDPFLFRATSVQPSWSFVLGWMGSISFPVLCVLAHPVSFKIGRSSPPAPVQGRPWYPEWQRGPAAKANLPLLNSPVRAPFLLCLGRCPS